MSETPERLLSIENLRVTFTGLAKPVTAVDGVDLALARGEVVALLGESGSGKSVTLRSILRLHAANKTRIEGRIRVDGQDVMALAPRELAQFRGKTVSMVFQEPMLALDPVYKVGSQIIEAIRRHDPVSIAEARQRAMIALALSCKPRVLLADEPTTALDATVQVQILLLLRELQRELGLAMIFVTHDISVAVEVADRVAVMYAGRIVELGAVRDVVRRPRHPYTIGLLSTRAHGGRLAGARLPAIPGSPPDLANLPPGCPYAPRCAHAADVCRAATPPAVAVGDGHLVRCARTDATAPL